MYPMRVYFLLLWFLLLTSCTYKPYAADTPYLYNIGKIIE